MQNGVYVEKDISIWGYLHNKMVFSYKLLSVSIIHQDLCFAGIALKIEFVVFVYELITYDIIFITWLCNSSFCFTGVEPKLNRHCCQKLLNKL